MAPNRTNRTNRTNKNRAWIISLIGALATSLIFHFGGKNDTLGIRELFSTNTYYFLILTLVFVMSFVTLFTIFNVKTGKWNLENPENPENIENIETRKRKKNFRIDMVFLFIDAFMTVLFAKYNWNQITSSGTMWAIAEIAAFFAIVWMIFELFHHFKFFPKKILRFMFDFTIKVCIPTMFLIIVLLGAYQAKYNYADIFRPEIEKSGSAVGLAVTQAFNNVVLMFYDLGQSNPNLWIWLPIAAFFVMTLALLIYTFTITETEKSEGDEDLSAQEILDKVITEEKTKMTKTAKDEGFFDGLGSLDVFFHWVKEKLETKRERKRRLINEELIAKTGKIKPKIYKIQFHHR